MEIIVGKTAGFCYGVKNAVDKTKESVQKQKETYCLGELVHNKQVTQSLEEQGLIIINNVEEAKNNVIIRSHGVPKEVYERAEELDLKVIDLTCPNVLKIHNIVKEYSSKNYYIFIIGQKDHAETIGTVSYCRKNSTILEKQEDVEKAIKNFKESNLKKLLIVSQTTFSVEKFNKIVKDVEENIDKNTVFEVKNTICNATNIRQKETQEIAKQVDLMIIIGGKHSSNTTKLYEIAKQVDLMIIIGGKHSSNTNKLYQIAKKECNKCLLIETAEELDKDYIIKSEKIGIMAGASTPKESIESTVEKIKKMC